MHRELNALTAEELLTTCTTCGTQLRIQDPAAIGNIVACPNCGGMVMVQPDGDDDDIESQSEADANHAEPVASGSSGFSWLGLATGAGCASLLGVGVFVWLASPADDVAKFVPPATGQSATGQSATGQSVADPIDPIESITDASYPEENKQPVASTFDDELTQPTLVPESGPPDHEAEPDIVRESIAHADSTTADVTSDAEWPEGFEPSNKHETSPKAQTNVLASLTSILEGGEVSSIEPEHDANSAPTSRTVDPTAEVAPHATHAATGEMTPRQPSHGSPIRAQLSRQLPSVRFQAVPLIDFLRFVSNWTTVPMQLEPAALEQTGQLATTPVTFSAKYISAEDLLHQALEPIKLLPLIENDVVRITSARLEDTSFTDMTLFVGDLLSGEDFDLSRLVSTLIEPNSWDTVGGPGTIEIVGDRLKINHTRYVKIQTLLLLEKLRLARGLRSRAKLPARYLQRKSRWDGVRRRLRQPLSMDIWDKLPLHDVLLQLEARSGFRILVDWQSLAALGFCRTTPTSLFVRDATADEVFRQLTEPRQWTLIPLDSETVQIVAKVQAEQRPYLELYSLQQLGDTGIARLEELMNSRAGRFALDPSSDTAIVVAGADAHRSLIKE